MSGPVHLQLVRTALAVWAAALLGCGSRVLVPPRVSLGGYPTIGIVVFRTNASGGLQSFASQQFMQAVQSAQPGVRLLELGSEAEVLRAISRSQLDFEAMRAIGAKWNVDAVFAGELEVTPLQPRVQVRALVESLSMKAEVQASLHAKLVETHGGATVWTRSGRASQPVAEVHVDARGPVDFGARDPERAYGSLVHTLVDQVTYDFYARWERR